MTETKDNYLEQKLVFVGDRIEVEGCGFQVMMSWERPLMHRMADIVAARRGDVLEVGFGMGLSCDRVQSHKPHSHTIIEAHPQIIERAELWCEGKANTRIVPGRWQDVISDLGPFDGVSFDVYGGQGQRLDFFSRIGELLKPGGVATLWLGDEQSLPSDLATTLHAQGLAHRMSRVVAIPDQRCTYSRVNNFCIPVIFGSLTRSGA